MPGKGTSDKGPFSFLGRANRKEVPPKGQMKCQSCGERKEESERWGSKIEAGWKSGRGSKPHPRWAGKKPLKFSALVDETRDTSPASPYHRREKTRQDQSDLKSHNSTKKEGHRDANRGPPILNRADNRGKASLSGDEIASDRRKLPKEKKGSKSQRTKKDWGSNGGAEFRGIWNRAKRVEKWESVEGKNMIV